jgi:hypothetical protein
MFDRHPVRRYKIHSRERDNGISRKPEKGYKRKADQF